MRIVSSSRRRGQRPAPRPAECGSSQAPPAIPGQASIITTRSTPARCRQKLGMAGKGEARPVLQRLLVDRRGADRRSLTRLHQRNRPLDHRNHPRRIGRVRPAGQGRRRKVVPQDRQHTRAHRSQTSRIATSRHAVPSGRCRGSPIQTNRSPRKPQAFAAISGPIPDGSPEVRTGIRIRARSRLADDGRGAQFFQDSPQPCLPASG